MWSGLIRLTGPDRTGLVDRRGYNHRLPIHKRPRSDPRHRDPFHHPPADHRWNPATYHHRLGPYDHSLGPYDDRFGPDYYGARSYYYGFGPYDYYARQGHCGSYYDCEEEYD